MKTFKTKNGLELPVIDLKGKDYLQVMHRLLWFRSEHPDWSIKTELILNGNDFSVFKATIANESGEIISTAHGREDMKGFADYNEKAETKAIGRALAHCGYGTQFAAELDEGERIVDSPAPYKAPTSAINSPRHNEDFDFFDSPVKKTSFNTGQPSASGAKELVLLFGPDKGKPLSKLTKSQLSKDIEYWESRSRKEAKPLTGEVKNMVDEMKRLLLQK